MNNDTNNQTFFNREQTRGFIFALLAFGALEAARQWMLAVNPWYVVWGPSIFGGVIFFAAFFALNNPTYKKYAKGALLGWAVYVVIAMSLSAVFR